MEEKIKAILARLHEIELEIGSPGALADQKRYRQLNQEYARLRELQDVWDSLTRVRNDLFGNEQLLKEESDAEMAQMLRDDTAQLEKREGQLDLQLKDLLVPPNPDDHRNTILELRAGTGGDEAALFVGDCVRMYQLYADQKGLKVERLSASPSEIGGFKEYVMVLSGPNVHRLLQHEAGTHRVQRVPATETQGRVHTSAVTIAVLLEPDEEEEVEIDEKELRIDTMRASGAGGQHVNVTDSAVRITHLPTGVVVGCQDERSQHKNREKAMRMLKAKILEAQRKKAEAEISQKRATMIGSGDRSERIRTYNFPQNRVTDHRIGLSNYNLPVVLNGDLDEFIDGLTVADRAEKLAAAADEE